MERRDGVSVVLPTYNGPAASGCASRDSRLSGRRRVIVAQQTLRQVRAGGQPDVAPRCSNAARGYGAAIPEVSLRHPVTSSASASRTARSRQRTAEAAALRRRRRMVFGSRTVMTFIWDGANMGLFLRWGNWAVAKLIEALFNTTY